MAFKIYSPFYLQVIFEADPNFQKKIENLNQLHTSNANLRVKINYVKVKFAWQISYPFILLRVWVSIRKQTTKKTDIEVKWVKTG